VGGAGAVVGWRGGGVMGCGGVMVCGQLFCLCRTVLGCKIEDEGKDRQNVRGMAEKG
jgi:hypothetical protein